LTLLPFDGNIISIVWKVKVLARRIPDELKVCILTVFGAVSILIIALLLSRSASFRELVLAGERDFALFVTYGLAFSLLVAASRYLRARDAAILILVASVIWGVVVERPGPYGMVRFLLFASGAAIGFDRAVKLGRNASRGQRFALRVLIPMIYCGLGGVVYHLVAGDLSGSFSEISRIGVVGLIWGVCLGLAVGLGLSVGREVINWVAEKP
jgi:hypothetical protein